MWIGDPLPHRHFLTKELMTTISHGYEVGIKSVMEYLSNLSHVTVLVDAESLYSHSFVVIDAFPNVAKTAPGDRILGRPDETFVDDV